MIKLTYLPQILSLEKVSKKSEEQSQKVFDPNIPCASNNPPGQSKTPASLASASYLSKILARTSSGNVKK